MQTTGFPDSFFSDFSGERGLDVGTRPRPVRLHGRLPPQLHDRARPLGQPLQARVHLQFPNLSESSGQSGANYLVKMTFITTGVP